MDGMQKAVAKNMEKTLEVPVFRVSREIVTDDFDALYAQLKPKGVTVSAMLAKVGALLILAQNAHTQFLTYLPSRSSTPLLLFRLAPRS
jgi:hypothetical protein